MDAVDPRQLPGPSTALVVGDQRSRRSTPQPRPGTGAVGWQLSSRMLGTPRILKLLVGPHLVGLANPADEPRCMSPRPARRPRSPAPTRPGSPASRQPSASTCRHPPGAPTSPPARPPQRTDASTPAHHGGCPPGHGPVDEPDDEHRAHPSIAHIPTRTSCATRTSSCLVFAGSPRSTSSASCAASNAPVPGRG